jgi:uncharacterized membrane protein
MSEEIKTQQTVPYAIAVLVLGICSLVFGCVFVGLICGIVGCILASKGNQIYQQNPEAYTNYGMLNAGRIMSIIGIVLGALYTVYYIIFVAILGSAVAGIGVLDSLM